MQLGVVGVLGAREMWLGVAGRGWADTFFADVAHNLPREAGLIRAPQLATHQAPEELSYNITGD